MKQLALIGILAILVLGCGGPKTYTQQEERAFEQLQQLVNNKRLDIQSNRARPMATNAFMQVANSNLLGPGNTASSIDLTTNQNRLVIEGDSIRGYFPYFGEVQFGGGYRGGNHQGIEFNDVPEAYSVEFDEQKHRAEVNFKIRDQYRTNETYNIYMTLFPNGSSNVRVQSSNRTPIEFSGNYKALKEEDPKAMNP